MCWRSVPSLCSSAQFCWVRSECEYPRTTPIPTSADTGEQVSPVFAFPETNNRSPDERARTSATRDGARHPGYCPACRHNASDTRYGSCGLHCSVLVVFTRQAAMLAKDGKAVPVEAVDECRALLMPPIRL